MLSLAHNEHAGKLILRLGVGALLLLHGIAKVGATGTLARISARVEDWSLPGVAAYGVFIGELLAPLMIVFGWYSRIGGLLAAADIVVAVVLMRLPYLFKLNAAGGWALELEGLFLCGALAIFFLGSGRYAVRPD